MTKRTQFDPLFSTKSPKRKPNPGAKTAPRCAALAHNPMFTGSAPRGPAAQRNRMLQHNRILSGAPAVIFMPVRGRRGHLSLTTEFLRPRIALPASTLICSPIVRHQPRGPAATNSAPRHRPDRRLPNVNSMISKARWVCSSKFGPQPQTRPQCTILHHCA
jgi:hypothetical protein